VGQTLAVAAELAVPFDAPSGDYELVLCGLRDASDQPAEAAIGAVTIQGRFAAPVTRPPRLGAPQLAGRGAARAGTTWSFGVAFTSMAGVPEPPRRLVVRLELGPHLCYLAESFAVPATSWRAGGKVELGPFALALPADLPAGEYGVQVALAGEPHAEGSPPNRAAGTLRVRGPATPESTTLKPLAYGTFVDSRGAAHPWYSTPSHALVWDGEPFLPVSGMFNGPYMSWARGPAEFAKLQANVEALRRHGLDHVYLYTQGTMEAMPAHCWEFLMDYLESQGMSYVIGYPGGSPGVDTAIDARPIRARPDLALAVEGVSLPGTASRRLTGPELGCSPKAVVSCLALALGADGRPYGPVDATPGPATDSDVEVTAPFVLLPAGTYRVLFLPRVHASFCCANPWGKADEQIEKAAAYLSRIRFRPGFRGFIDLILPNERGIYNEAESLFIEEPAFLEDRARWLAERHGSLDRLAEAWALLDAPPAGFATAAGLFPAYAGESLLLVGAAGPRVYRADAARSLFWYEYLEHRDESYARLQNRLCDAIRERVDVPITIKRCGVTERYHSNPNRADRGVDGAGYEIYASGDNLAPYGAGPGYAEMLQARKCMIGAATEFNRAFAEDGPANWPDVAAFFYDLAVAQHLGAKGTYLFLFDVLPHNYLTRNRLIEDSRMLEWMGLWKRILDSRRDEVAAHTPLAYTSWPPGDSWIPGGPVPASAARCARRTTRRGPSRPRPPTASGSCPSGTPRHRRR
jgi:hypothetical protein